MKACPKCGKRFLGDEEFCPTDGETLVVLEEEDKGDALVGTTVDGRYHVDKKIGEGGMGMVYLATHAVIGKKCAIKVLRSEMTGEAEVGQRFLQEAQSAAAIGNEHIIEINDFGQLPDGSAYFVMEFLDGTALQDAIEEANKMSIERTVKIMIQCCDALSAAHNANVVHRDLKPDNIFLITRGKDTDFVKVLDFGIAKVAGGNSRLTKTGMIFGTPQYMSPEQAAGTGVDARTDIYSLGIIMYEMICGHVPFEADTFMGVLTKHLYEEPIPPRRLVPPTDVEPGVEAVLLNAIAKKPEKRYQTMADFCEDLKAISEGRTPEIVYEQMRDTSSTTVPPPPPSSVVGAKSSTVYGGGNIKSASKRRWPIFAGLGILLVVGAAAAFLLPGGFGEGKQVAAQEKQEMPVVAIPETKAPVVSAPQEEAAEVKKPEIDIETVKLSSNPQGASLFKGKALMGKLPIDLKKPSQNDEPQEYLIKLDGYEELSIIISASTPEVFELSLDRIKKKRRKKSSSPSSSSGSRSSGSSSSPIKVKVKKKKSHTDLADPWG